jgi:hypothetical protein
MARVDRCANPECNAEFKRLGTGKLYTFPVARPQVWGLPASIKQKVVWLCSKCAATRDVQFDAQQHQVVLIKRERSRRQSA